MKVVSDLNPDALDQPLRLPRICVHLLTAGLLVLAVLRAFLGPGPPPRTGTDRGCGDGRFVRRRATHGAGAFTTQRPAVAGRPGRGVAGVVRGYPRRCVDCFPTVLSAAVFASDPGRVLQLRRVDEATYVLRESMGVTWEAPFVYLLLGSDRTLLLDTGAVARQP